MGCWGTARSINFFDDRCAIHKRGLFWSLCSVLGTALFPIRHSVGVLGSSDYVIPDARQILDTATADKDHGVFLKVVTNAGDVRCDLITVSKSDSGDFSQS